MATASVDARLYQRPAPRGLPPRPERPRAGLAGARPGSQSRARAINSSLVQVPAGPVGDCLERLAFFHSVGIR